MRSAKFWRTTEQEGVSLWGGGEPGEDTCIVEGSSYDDEFKEELRQARFDLIAAHREVEIAKQEAIEAKEIAKTAISAIADLFGHVAQQERAAHARALEQRARLEAVIGQSLDEPLKDAPGVHFSDEFLNSLDDSLGDSVD